MFAICEKDGPGGNKNIWSTYLIVTKEETKQVQANAGDKYVKWKGKLMATL